MSRRDDEDLRELLADLEDALGDLREVVGDDARGPRRPPRPRPPTPTELLRFTEEYTIPTLVSLLETTIRALELLRALLRVADPERRFDASGEVAGGVAAVGRERAERGVATALSELQRALSETDLPPEGDARDLVREARSLTEEIEERLRETRAERERPRRERTDRPVSIDVAEEGEREDDEASVDIDAELESIRREVNDGVGADAEDASAEDEDEGTDV